MARSRILNRRNILLANIALLILVPTGIFLHLDRKADIVRYMEKEHLPWSREPGKYDHIADFVGDRMRKFDPSVPTNHPLLVWIRCAGYRCYGFTFTYNYSPSDLDLLSTSVFRDLEFLQLGNRDMTAEKLRQIGPKPHCLYLDLENCREVDDEALAVIARNFPQLEAINLKGTSVRGEGLAQLRHLKSEKLVAGLRHVSPFAKEDLQALVDSCPQLSYLNAPLLTDDDLVPLYSATNLWGLDLRQCNIEGHIGQELHQFPNLDWLYFGGIQPHYKRDTDLVAFGAPVPTVTRLGLSLCDISGEQMKAIVQRFPNLEELWIDKAKLDGTSLSVLAQLKNLTRLNLYEADFGDTLSKTSIDLPLEWLNIDRENQAAIQISPQVKEVANDVASYHDWFPGDDYHFDDF